MAGQDSILWSLFSNAAALPTNCAPEILFEHNFFIHFDRWLGFLCEQVFNKSLKMEVYWCLVQQYVPTS